LVLLGWNAPDRIRGIIRPIAIVQPHADILWYSITLHVKHAEDRVALAEMEALERVSRAEAENVTVLASTREDVESLA
jgi:hypothetical protein